MNPDETGHDRGAEMTFTDPMTILTDHVGTLAEDGYRRRRDADLARITAAGRAPARADHRILPAQRRRTRPILAGVAVAAAAAVTAGVLALPGDTPRHGRATPPVSTPLDARSVLLAGAEYAAKQPATAHGAYWYSQIRDVERARQRRKGVKGHGTLANGAPRSGPYFPFHAYVSITWENWDPYQQGRPSRTVDRDIQTRFATPADKAAWQRAGSPSLTDMKPFSADSHTDDDPYLELGPKGTTMAGLAKLPTTAAGLRRMVQADRNRRIAELRKYHAQSQELSLTEDILDAGVAVINAPAPPKARAAAYRMLAAQKGIRGIGPARDGLGRSGVALAVRIEEHTLHGIQRSEEHLIIDPGSARILAFEYYPIGADGTVASEPDHSTLMITDGWTDRIGVPSHD
ncbi:hypothetical protein GCM10023191_011700 [Actinoallomurus oryzae]|uniref:CU044_5270 family protein n=2 Tax=Actinoallomurus oryzae TaxID=502180 RepID=A0ABP8PFW3_9ACTN